MMTLRTRMRQLRRMLRTTKLGTLLYFIVVVSLFLIALKWFVKVFPNPVDFYSLRHGVVRTSENSLAVFVLSNRENFDRREAIRSTWALGHNNVFFVVGEQYCPYPPENQVIEECSRNNYSLSRERLKFYLVKEDKITRQLQGEKDVILVPSRDGVSELPKKVTESYRWALRTLRATWFLHVDDTVELEVDKIENYLETNFKRSENTVILSSVKRDYAVKSGGKVENKSVFLGRFQCGLNHIVSRCVAQYTVGGSSTLFEYGQKHSYNGIRIANSVNITSERYTNMVFIGNGICNTSTILQFDVCLKRNDNIDCLDNFSMKTQLSKRERNTAYTLFENPSTYLHSDRFDLIIKMVYAHSYAFKTRIPKVMIDAYVEHIRVSNFSEYCHELNDLWHDTKRPCEEQHSGSDFISAFHNTIDTIRKFEFNSSMYSIAVDKTGCLVNGAHILAASVALSKYTTLEHQHNEKHLYRGYKYYKSVGLTESTFNFVMLEWMKLQVQLPCLKTSVSIVSVFSHNPGKDEAMRKIVKERCSKDNGILYETSIKFTRYGARQLITHMYGQQSWLEVKIQQMLSKFESTTYSVLFLFVYGKGKDDLLQCKNEIRKLYNDKIFKSSSHIPDTAEENLILAEMILNPNSLQFMNHAKDAADCKRIAGEIATRSITPPIETLPKMYVGNDGIMVDSGAVLGFFGLRKRTDIDILFLHDVDKSILGNSHGLNIQAHAFRFNSISKERPWGEDHFSEKGPVDQWDLFYDPENYGYCYGIKFVSLQQLIRYKIRRNEPKKDQYDVRLINELLKTV